MEFWMLVEGSTEIHHYFVYEAASEEDMKRILYGSQFVHVQLKGQEKTHYIRSSAVIMWGI